MADNANEEFANRPPDPFVAARVSKPGETPAPTFELAGLLGDSEREGYRRLYLNTALDYYAEFKTADVVSVAAVPPDTPPFVGLDATRVTLAKDAAVEYVRVQRGGDAFDLEAVGGNVALTPGPDGTLPTDLTVTGGPQVTTIPPTDFTLFGCEITVQRCLTLQTCFTCGNRCFTQQVTCVTCGRATCQTCFQATCQTCNQATCVTCNQTCVTCNRVTCRTCDVQGCWPTITGVLTRAGCISRQVRCPTLACP